MKILFILAVIIMVLKNVNLNGKIIRFGFLLNISAITTLMQSIFHE